MREVDFDGLKADTRAVQSVLNGVGQTGLLGATEAQVLLQMLIEHIPVGILVAYGAPDFPVVLVNRAAEVLLGCSRDALLGRPSGAHATVFSLLPLGESAREACQGLPLYQTAYLGHIVQDEEWSLLRADGLDVPVYQQRFGSEATVDLPQLAELSELDLLATENPLRLNGRGLELSDVIGPWLCSAAIRQRMAQFALT